MTNRCLWVIDKKPDYIDYHDNEWGVAVYDDQKLFEMLILEGAQAGLNWYTILSRRQGYKKAFKNFDPDLVAKMSDVDLEEILLNKDVIRNRLKIFSARQNALVFLAIQKEFGSFSNYLWGFVNNKTIVSRPPSKQDLMASSKESDVISKDLRQRGMNFVGSKIIYAYMQAVGLVDDHMACCYKAK